jgi:hypothetical protein
MRMLKSSTDSPSRNVSTLNSRFSELALAFFTQSTQTLRIMIESHAAFVVGLLTMDPSMSGGTALAITSNVIWPSV